MDDIVLPPMPDAVDLAEVIRNYARAAVIADRKRRAEAEPEPEKVHQAMICFGGNGDARVYTGGYTTGAMHLVRWTNGRVWIDSEDRRGVASDLRRAALWLRSEDAHVFAAACARAADLLDGGER